MDTDSTPESSGINDHPQVSGIFASSRPDRGAVPDGGELQADDTVDPPAVLIFPDHLLPSPSVGPVWRNLLIGSCLSRRLSAHQASPSSNINTSSKQILMNLCGGSECPNPPLDLSHIVYTILYKKIA